MHDVPYIQSKHFTPEVTATLTRVATEIKRILPERTPCGIQVSRIYFITTHSCLNRPDVGKKYKIRHPSVFKVWFDFHEKTFVSGLVLW